MYACVHVKLVALLRIPQSVTDIGTNMLRRPLSCIQTRMRTRMDFTHRMHRTLRSCIDVIEVPTRTCITLKYVPHRWSVIVLECYQPVRRASSSSSSYSDYIRHISRYIITRNESFTRTPTAAPQAAAAAARPHSNARALHHPQRSCALQCTWIQLYCSDSDIRRLGEFRCGVETTRNVIEPYRITVNDETQTDMRFVRSVQSPYISHNIVYYVFITCSRTCSFTNMSLNKAIV